MRKRIPVLYVIVSLLTFWGCSKFKVGSFVMPTWDTQFSAPIFSRTYTLGEILSKDTTMVSNGDTTFIRNIWPVSVFSLFRTQQINATSIGANLKIGDVPQTNAAQSPGDFTISDPSPTHYALTNPALPVGTTVPVLQSTPSQAESLSPDFPFSQFNSATMSGGNLHISIRNGYPASLSFSNGIDVVDASNNVIFNIPIPGNSLGPNQVDTINKPLAGIILSTNTPSVSFTYSSPGSATPVTFQSDTLMTVTFSLIGVKVSSASAIVPKQPDIVISQSIVLTDGNKVISANIDNGNLNLNVTNEFNLPVPTHLVINSLVNQNGSLTKDFNLTAAGTPGSSYQEIISLAGYQLSMADAGGNPTDSLHYTVTAQVPGSSGQFVDIATTDSVKATFNLTGLQFSSFTGEVHLKNPVGIATDTQKVNLGDFRSKFNGAVTFSDSTTLVMKINMSSGFPFLMHLSLIPRNSSSNAVINDSLTVNQMIYPNQPNYITLGPDFVNVLNSFTASSSSLPDEFIISGNVTVNPGPPYAIGTVSMNDEVEGTGTITMPFDLGITNAHYSDSTNKPVITDSSTSSKLGNVDSGSVVFEVNNGLPLAISLTTELIDTLPGHQVIPMDNIVIPAAADFNPDGTVRTPMFSRNEFVLTHDQAAALGHSYMKFNFGVATSPGQQTVLFTKNNTISLKVYANLAFKIDKNLVSK